MIYLVVGIDRNTHSSWHQNIVASDPGSASSIARGRAAAGGRQLMVAAVIGPGAEVLAADGDRTQAA